MNYYQVFCSRINNIKNKARGKIQRMSVLTLFMLTVVVPLLLNVGRGAYAQDPTPPPVTPPTAPISETPTPTPIIPTNPPVTPTAVPSSPPPTIGPTSTPTPTSTPIVDFGQMADFDGTTAYIQVSNPLQIPNINQDFTIEGYFWVDSCATSVMGYSGVISRLHASTS